jgi:SAM-dependent methyltransferase
VRSQKQNQHGSLSFFISDSPELGAAERKSLQGRQMTTPPRNPFDPSPLDEGRLDAPAFHRNHEPIWSVLGPWLLTQTGNLLEAGSGTGQHVADFARRSPNIMWWPSDYSDAHIRSIDAWRQHSGLSNIQPARRIDLAAPDWGLSAEDSSTLRNLTAIFCANVVHIAPWNVAEGLLGHAADRLKKDGRLYLYGPFMRDGEHTAPSNAAFDASLRSRDPAWGVRDVAEVRAVATASGLLLARIVAMPANNFILVFERAGKT